MSSKQTIFLSFLAGILGSLFVNLGSKLYSNHGMQKVSQNQTLSASKPAEPAPANEMSKPAEQKTIDTKKEKSTDEKEVPDPEETSGYKKTDPTYAYGGISAPFSTVKKNPKPLQVRNAEFLKLYPKAFLENVGDIEFGFEKGKIPNTNQYLKQHVCAEPKFYMISEDQRMQSKFFEAVKENTYRGPTVLHFKTPNPKFVSIFQYMSPLYDGLDFIEIKDDVSIMEKRVINNEVSGAAWRFNTCSSSVTLLSDRCPWDSTYSLEYKDLFVSPVSKKLVGNIYCKKTSDTKWTQVGTLDLNQSAE